MAAEDDASVERPELPRLLGRRYRPRARDPGPDARDAPVSLTARDTVLDRELDLERVAFDAGEVARRDALVAALKRRTTVLAPSLVAIHDAGEWEHDAFVVHERVESGVSLDEALASGPTMAERLRWSVALADAALAVDEADLALPTDRWAAARVDAYRTPRVDGLARATEATDASRVETVRALGRLLTTLASSTVAPSTVTSSAPLEGEDEEARLRLRQLADDASSGALGLSELRSRLGRIAGAPEPQRPLIPHADPGATSARGAGALIAGVGLLVLAFAVLVTALILAR